jgi:hypothetical protein
VSLYSRYLFILIINATSIKVLRIYFVFTPDVLFDNYFFYIILYCHKLCILYSLVKMIIHVTRTSFTSSHRLKPSNLIRVTTMEAGASHGGRMFAPYIIFAPKLQTASDRFAITSRYWLSELRYPPPPPVAQKNRNAPRVPHSPSPLIAFHADRYSSRVYETFFLALRHCLFVSHCNVWSSLFFRVHLERHTTIPRS